jgi:hypothetical protein
MKAMAFGNVAGPRVSSELASIDHPLRDTHRPLTQPHLTARMADVLERIRRANRPPFHTLSVPEARAAYVAASEILELPRAPLARVQEFDIPADDGTPLPARLYAPSHVVRGVTHDFIKLGRALPEAGEAQAAAAAASKKASETP